MSTNFSFTAAGELLSKQGIGQCYRYNELILVVFTKAKDPKICEITFVVFSEVIAPDRITTTFAKC